VKFDCHSLVSFLLPQALCSLLKRDVTMSFKSKGNALVSVLACNVLLAAHKEDEIWPDTFVKVLYATHSWDCGGCTDCTTHV